MTKQNDLEEVLINKDVKEDIKTEKVYRESPAFPLDILPKDFSKVTKKEILFIRESLKKRNIPKLKEYYNLKLSLFVDCYLLNPNVFTGDITKFVFAILEGIAFKNNKNIQQLKIRISDSTKDPYNLNENYIGVSINRFEEKKHPKKIILEI